MARLREARMQRGDRASPGGGAIFAMGVHHWSLPFGV